MNFGRWFNNCIYITISLGVMIKFHKSKEKCYFQLKCYVLLCNFKENSYLVCYTNPPATVHHDGRKFFARIYFFVFLFRHQSTQWWKDSSFRRADVCRTWPSGVEGSPGVGAFSFTVESSPGVKPFSCTVGQRWRLRNIRATTGRRITSAQLHPLDASAC